MSNFNYHPSKESLEKKNGYLYCASCGEKFFAISKYKYCWTCFKQMKQPGYETKKEQSEKPA